MRGLWIGASTIAIAVSCGGETDDVGTSRSTGGTGGSAAGGSGGQSGSGGRSGSGGQSGSAGIAGTAGNEAGTGVDCFAEPRFRDCEGGAGFYFDEPSGTCKSFGLHHCPDGPNGFWELQGCLAACPNARPDVTACNRVADCVIMDKGCCPACEPVTADSLIAVNTIRAQTGDYKLPCDAIACGACPPVDELETTRQHFVPTCYAGACGLQDVRDSQYAVCGSDADCILRDGAQCCEGCDGRGLVAVNPSNMPPICEGNMGCPACAPIIPDEYGVQCQSGRCRVIRSVDAGAR